MNMESTTNVTPSSSVNIAENFRNVNNLQQQTLDLSRTEIGMSDFQRYNRSQINNSATLDKYDNYNSVFNSDFLNHNYKAQDSTLTSRQNGVTSTNGVLLVSTIQAKDENHDYLLKNSNSTQNLIKNNHTISSPTATKPVTLNIPKYMVKSDSRSKDEMDQKQERVLIDSIKRKSLENTVRLIETILMNTTKRTEMLQKEQHNVEVSNNVYKLPEDSDYNKNNNNSIREENSNIVQCNSKSNSDSFEQPSLIAVNDDTNPELPTNLSVPKIQIKIEPLDEHENDNYHIEIDPNIVVKVEEMETWEDDKENPFLYDIHGVREVGPDVEIVKDSVKMATEALVNAPKSSPYYSCPQCGLLIQHPKRFLIHHKWHSFGLLGIKREEVKKEKELIKQKRREEFVRIKEEQALDPETGQRMYRCTTCDKRFPTKNSMKYHRKKVHPNVQEKIRECSVCNMQFKDWKSLYNHRKTHLPASEHNCDVCQKKFKHAHSLAKHKQTHLEKTHQCSDCPKAFGSAYLLKTHMKTHERVAQGQTHSCSYCGKGYYNAYTLQVHERTHRNEKPFVCDICNTSYGTNSSLTRHLKVSHGGAKPYECAVCHRCFISPRIMERHAARAHGDPALLSHACSLCPSRYLSAKYLRKHMEKMHKIEWQDMKRAKQGSVSE